MASTNAVEKWKAHTTNKWEMKLNDVLHNLIGFREGFYGQNKLEFWCEGDSNLASHFQPKTFKF